MVIPLNLYRPIVEVGRVGVGTGCSPKGLPPALPPVEVQGHPPHGASHRKGRGWTVLPPADQMFQEVPPYIGICCQEKAQKFPGVSLQWYGLQGGFHVIQVPAQ